MVLFGDMSGWGAAGVGSLMTATLIGVGTLVARYFRGKGGYAKDVADATVTVSAEERKARREHEDAQRQARRDEDDAERRQESAILREYKTLVAEQKTDLAEQRELIHKLRDQMQVLTNELAVCRAGRAKADERIAALEEALDEAKIPHRVWHPDGDGSSPHKPLPGSDK